VVIVLPRPVGVCRSARLSSNVRPRGNMRRVPRCAAEQPKATRFGHICAVESFPIALPMGKRARGTQRGRSLRDDG
jgi:hypothetical protein